jgi:hypothetical protein
MICKLTLLTSLLCLPCPPPNMFPLAGIEERLFGHHGAKDGRVWDLDQAVTGIVHIWFCFTLLTNVKVLAKQALVANAGNVLLATTITKHPNMRSLGGGWWCCRPKEHAQVLHLLQQCELNLLRFGQALKDLPLVIVLVVLGGLVEDGWGWWCSCLGSKQACRKSRRRRGQRRKRRSRWGGRGTENATGKSRLAKTRGVVGRCIRCAKCKPDSLGSRWGRCRLEERSIEVGRLESHGSGLCKKDSVCKKDNVCKKDSVWGLVGD